MTFYRVYFKHLSADSGNADFAGLVNEAYITGQIKSYKNQSNINRCYSFRLWQYCENVTICYVEDESHKVITKGFAFFVPPLTHEEKIKTKPSQKQFNKEEGRRISLDRAKFVMGKTMGINLKEVKFITNWKDKNNGQSS